MATKPDDASNGVSVRVDPGICGFVCTIKVRREGREVSLDIQSACEQIQKLRPCVGRLSMKDLFLPHTKNPVFLCAERARCHVACPIPVSLVKAAEVALGLALPRDATLTFENDPR